MQKIKAHSSELIWKIKTYFSKIKSENDIFLVKKDIFLKELKVSLCNDLIIIVIENLKRDLQNLIRIKASVIGVFFCAQLLDCWGLMVFL